MSQRLLTVCRPQSITRNNLTLRYPDGKDAEVAKQEKINEEKRSLSPKHISPYYGDSPTLSGRKVSTNRRPSDTVYAWEKDESPPLYSAPASPPAYGYGTTKDDKGKIALDGLWDL